MTLHDWMLLADLTDKDFAQVMGVHRHTIERWRSGKVKPSWQHMEAIARQSRNKVTPNDFWDKEPLLKGAKRIHPSMRTLYKIKEWL